MVTPLVDIETLDNDADVDVDASDVFSLMEPILLGYDRLTYADMGPGPRPTTDQPSPTTPLATAEAPSGPSPTTPPDLGSPACVACTNRLGASSCTSEDCFCLVQQCQQDEQCTACRLDWDQYRETPLNPPDMCSEVCQTCMTALGASSCPADDLGCLTNDCKHSTECLSCGIDCDTVGR